MKQKKKTKLDKVNKRNLIVGIDIGKRKHLAGFVNAKGYEMGKTISFSNDKFGMESLIEKVEKIKKERKNGER